MLVTCSVCNFPLSQTAQGIFLEHFGASLLIHVKVSLEYVQRNGIAGSKSGCISNPPKSCQIALHLSTWQCSISHSLAVTSCYQIFKKIIAKLRGIKLLTLFQFALLQVGLSIFSHVFMNSFRILHL